MEKFFSSPQKAQKFKLGYVIHIFLISVHMSYLIVPKNHKFMCVIETWYRILLKVEYLFLTLAQDILTYSNNVLKWMVYLPYYLVYTMM